MHNLLSVRSLRLLLAAAACLIARPVLGQALTPRPIHPAPVSPGPVAPGPRPPGPVTVPAPIGGPGTAVPLPSPPRFRTQAMNAAQPALNPAMMPMNAAQRSVNPAGTAGAGNRFLGMSAGSMSLPNVPAVPPVPTMGMTGYAGGNLGGLPEYMPGGQPSMPGYGGTMPGDAGGAAGATNAAGYMPEARPDPETMSLTRILAAGGVPNDNGRLRWPMGLTILAAPEAAALRDQIDALFQLSARQTAGGVNASLLAETRTAIRKLRRLLLTDKEERFAMPPVLYAESERFLNKLEHAGQLLKAGFGASEETQLTAYNPPQPAAPSTGHGESGKVTELHLGDNYFEPRTYAVRVGTTVQWTNSGQHAHTVTADDGSWDSGEIAPQGVFRRTFSQPGAYPYHCAVHPQQMRGTIIVE